MTSHRLGKYACLELERRYLLFEKPADLALEHCLVITDRYLAGTRLRLRHMASLEGEVVALKLSQKFQAAGQHVTATTITNLYLDEAEYQALHQLNARVLVKHRYRYDVHGRRYSIDVFQGNLSGLILAEIEAETAEELATLPPPPFYCQDVTDDAFFRGGALACVSPADFSHELAKRSILLQQP